MWLFLLYSSMRSTHKYLKISALSSWKDIHPLFIMTIFHGAIEPDSRKMDRRWLYLELGYPSMFAFCTEHLWYSRSAVCRRIRAARCIGKYPEAAVMVASGETRVYTLAMISGVLNRDNRRDILNRIKGGSQREAQEELARRRHAAKIFWEN